MTPIKLRMKAFGPYVEPVELNFATGLRGAKIFLIHGATGAGKTTILDAISYALYGETSGKVRDAKDMRSKGVADSVPTEVEFTFALGNDTYKILREINYNSKRKENKYQTQVKLWCGKNLIETKDRAVKNKVMELLGFDAEQFRQVVILPQGEFKKFLFADSDKRQEVLNLLFDSTAYKEVEETLSEHAKDSAETVKKLEERREDLKQNLQGTDNESLDEVKAKLSALEKKCEELKKISDTAQSALTEGKLLAADFDNLQKTASELDTAQIEFGNAKQNFDAAEKEYKIRKAEETQRKELETKIRELKEIQSTLKDLKYKNDKLTGEQEKLDKAEKNFNEFKDRATRYEARLNELNALKVRLECEKILGEVLNLETDLSEAQEKVLIAEKNLNDAQIELNRLQIVNNAARLVMTLKEGEPCPVCGSIEHPAIIEAAIPTISELRAAEEKVNRLTKEKSRLEKNAENINGQLSEKKNRLEDSPELPEAQKNFISLDKTIADLKSCLQSIEKGNVYIEENENKLKIADKKQKDAQSEVDKLTGAISEAKKKIPEKYLANSRQLDDDLNAAQEEFSQLDSAWKTADKNFQAVGNIKSARQAMLKSKQESFNDLQAKLKDKIRPDISALEQNVAETSKEYDASRDEKAKWKSTLETLEKFSLELNDVNKKLEAAKKIADTWRRLSDVANATGKGESELKISFQRYFLSTMFNDVVAEANNRLKKMSNGRYFFQMKDAGKTKAKTAGLNLDIFDEQTGALRPVETLSGGESFLASLSLALGLASVVRNKVGGIKLDTIFIDEGFGSLDSETLDFAISTIIEQSGGRLVGIISHVEELKNQMPVRLEVTKTKTGSTAKFIS